MKKYHKIEKLDFKDEKLVLIINKKKYEYFLSHVSKKLLNASDIERKKYTISPSGYGIHWPLIDEDLSIDGLLGIKHTPSKSKKITVV